MEACFCLGAIIFLPPSGGGIGCPYGYDNDSSKKDAGFLYVFWEQAKNGNGYGSNPYRYGDE